MSSEWWDEGFNQQYTVIKKFCYTIVSLAFTIRFIVAFAVSYEAAFGNSQLYIMIVVSCGIGLLAYLDNSKIVFKKLYFFVLMQFFSMNNRYLSVKVAPNAVVPLCIHSTVLLLLFESYVFKSSLSIIFLMAKHIVLWVMIDFQEFTFRKDFQGKEAIVGMTSLISILLAFYFESNKRQNLFEKHQSMKSSQASHDQLLDTLKAFPDGLIIFDSDFKIKFQNDSISSFFPDSTITLGEKLFQYKVNQNQVSVLELVKELFNDTSRTSSSLGVSQVDHNQYEWRSHKITWDNQVCMMLSLRDVTKILEFERVSAEINSKNMIIRSISHEFRTPINCINLIVDEIYHKVEKDIQGKLDLIKTSTEILLYQVNDVLDYSDLTSNKFIKYESPVSLKEELYQCADLIKLQAEYKGVLVKCEVDKELEGKLLLDEYRVKKIVVNFLTNALKYTSTGSITLFAKRNLHKVYIGVKDTGIGIPQSRLKFIQQMFQNSSESSLSGLGLHVCSKILEKLNSKLQVKSDFGIGSTFSFELDFLNDKKYVIEEPEVPSESESKSRIRKNWPAQS